MNNRGGDILNDIIMPILGVIWWPFGLILRYLGKLLSAVAKNVHEKLVNWLGGIIFLVIIAILYSIFKR